MARTLNITVGGEQARIRCSIAGDVLSIMASKCFAAYIRLMKLATEGKYEMPVPDGSDRPRPPLELGAPMQPPLCMKDMGAFNADMAIRFPEDADKYIKAFLAGDDVAKTFDSVPPAPGTAKMFTLEEVQDLITKGVTAGLEAAGVVTKPEPVAELATKGEGPDSDGVGPLDPPTPPPLDPANFNAKELAALSQREREVLKIVLNGGGITYATQEVGYKDPDKEARRILEIPLFKNVVEHYGSPGRLQVATMK